MKATRMYLGEKRLKDVYVGATKWMVFKFKLVRTVKRAAIALLASYSLVAACYVIYAEFVPSNASASVNESEAVFEAKIESLKDSVIDQLISCESKGYKESDGLIVFDSNKVASLGVLQWQVKSVQYYYKLRTGNDITKKEAIELALNEQEARSLAKYVGFETKNMFGKDWFNCSRKHDLDKQVLLIKKLSE